MTRRLVFLAFLALTPAVSAAPQSNAAQSAAEERRLLNQLDTISKSLKELRNELSGFEERTEELRASEETHQEEFEVAQANIEGRKEQVEALIRTLYKLEKSGSLQQIFAAESAQTLRRQAHYLLEILRKIQHLTSDYLKETANHLEALEQLEKDRGDLKKIEEETRDREATLAVEQGRLREMLNQARSRQDIALRMMVEQADDDPRGSGALGLDDGINLGGNGIELVDTSSFTNLQGKMDWPVVGDLLRGFGGYTDAMGIPATNFGLDIKAQSFAPFRSVAPGRVQHVGYVDRNGLTVIVEHVGGYATVYAHAAQVSVVAGQQVGAGDTLGTVGETGVSDGEGPRLHFEIRYNHNPINPTPWLR